MKTRTKQALLGLTVIALVGTAGIAGTFAYLSGTSKDVVNEFTPNSVTVDLIEYDDNNNKVTGNVYDIVPGTTDKKDPQVKADVTLPSYVFVEIKDVVNREDKKLVDYTVSDEWTALEGTSNVYYREIEKSDEKYVHVLEGDTITYPASLTNEDLEFLAADKNTLTFTAFAIQKEPFEDAYQAYTQTTEVLTLSKDSTTGEWDIEALNQAIATAESSSVAVSLTEEVTTEKSIKVPEGKTLVLTMEEDASLTSTKQYAHAVVVEEGASLRIKGGTIDSQKHATAAVYNEGGSVTLDSVKLTRSEEAGIDADQNGGNSYYVILNHGTMILNNCNVEADGAYSSLIENGWQDGTKNTDGEESVLIINGGIYTGGLNTVKNDDYGVLTINSGTFTNIAQHAVQNYNVATINGGTFTSDSSAVWNCRADETMDKGELTINGGTFHYPEDYCGVYNSNRYGYFGTITISDEAVFATEYKCNNYGDGTSSAE